MSSSPAAVGPKHLPHRHPVTKISWLRGLLVLLGAAELLMVAGAAPVLLAVGVLGGVAMLAAAFTRSRTWLITLVVIGTVPFAVLGWAAVIPVLLLLTALSVTVPLALRRRPTPPR